MKDKEDVADRQQSEKFFSPTTTITSEPVGESSSTVEDVNEKECRRREPVNLAGSATKFSKKVLESHA